MIQGRNGISGAPHRPARPANLWPQYPERFRAVVGAYVAEAFVLGQTLMRISALALGLEEGFFSPYFRPDDA